MNKVGDPCLCERGKYDAETESDNVMIGRSYEGLKDDETGGQFKKSVKDKLEKWGKNAGANSCWNIGTIDEEKPRKHLP